MTNTSADGRKQPIFNSELKLQPLDRILRRKHYVVCGFHNHKLTETLLGQITKYYV